MISVGIDTGGTFTDFIAFDQESDRWFTAKVPSNPSDPLQAILAAIELSGIDFTRVSSLILGTTVGTNALLERKGAKLVFITSSGFEDVPFIQRGNRKFHYDLHWIKPKPFLERGDTLGVEERVDYRGVIETPLQLDDESPLVDELHRRVKDENLQAIAVSLLFSYLNPQHEIMLGDWLKKKFPELTVSLSHRVAPVWREFERSITTIADAYLKPMLKQFIHRVDEGFRENGFRGEWALMKSNGGMRIAHFAADEPVQLLLSGLAGGVMGGKFFGLPVSENLITLDIGGTSSDVAVISDGEQAYSMQYEVEFGLPLQLPLIDVTTIGAGGGSIAWIDGGGFLRVGPRSAGAVPGPACYDQGGSEPTVTDANLILGRLDPDYFLGGKIKLNTSLSLACITELGEKLGMNPQQAALAVIDIANDNMMNAVRLRTVEAGIDPRDYSLVAFGGAGGLHASAIANAMGISRVLIPPHPGLCSAFGALTADLRCDKVWTTSLRSDQLQPEELDSMYQVLSKEAESELRTQGFGGRVRIAARLALRYQGQNYEHDIEIAESFVSAGVLEDCYGKFNQLHDAFYGYKLSGEIIEIVNLTVTAVADSNIVLFPDYHDTQTRNVSSRLIYFSGQSSIDTPVYNRHTLNKGNSIAGPAVIEELDSTTLLGPGDQLTVNNQGVLVIDIGGQRRGDRGFI